MAAFKSDSDTWMTRNWAPLSESRLVGFFSGVWERGEKIGTLYTPFCFCLYIIHRVDAGREDLCCFCFVVCVFDYIYLGW